MIKEEIQSLVNSYDEDGDITISEIDKDVGEGNFKEQLEKIFAKYNIEFTTCFEDMFDSCGFDCWSYSIAWVENNEIQLVTYRVVSY